MSASLPVSYQLLTLQNRCLRKTRQVYLDNTMVSRQVTLLTGEPRKCLGTCMAVLTRTWSLGQCSGTLQGPGCLTENNSSQCPQVMTAPFQAAFYQCLKAQTDIPS